jgi:Trypsin-like peptidase domain
MCQLGRRCHVNAAGHKTFGTKFAPELVRRLASSSVQIVSRIPGTRQLLASGTLIAPNVVLCAAHSLLGQSPKTISFVLFYECDATSAPKGAFVDTEDNAPIWRRCTKLAEKRQGVCTAFLEVGKEIGHDYALLAVKWIDAQFRYVENAGIRLISVPQTGNPEVAEELEDLQIAQGEFFSPADSKDSALTLRVPRPLAIPRPGSELTGELLLIGHPYSRAKGQSYLCQPTQASVAALFQKDLENPSHKGAGVRGYAAARFDTHSGASGGGVFNERGEIVGVLRGDFGNRPETPKELHDKAAFLHLSAAATNIADLVKAGKSKDKGERLRQWIGGGAPLLKGDPVVDIDFKPQRRK